MEATCTICKVVPLTTENELATTVCRSCAEVAAIEPMSPARRPARPCDRCNSMQFIRAIPREQTHRTRDEHVAALAVAYEFRNAKQMIGVVQVNKGDSGLHPHGRLELYVCRRCGFVEWYCADPEHVPIGPAYMTEAIDYSDSDGGPFR